MRDEEVRVWGMRGRRWGVQRVSAWRLEIRLYGGMGEGECVRVSV